MILYWIKNRFLITLVLTALISGLVGVFFIMPNIKNECDNISKVSVYEKSDIDYDIPAPTKDQLDEIASLDFVDEVFGYYYTETDVKVNGNTIKTKILFSDYMDTVEMTMFNERRLIETGQNDFENPIYVDYEFVDKTGAGIGDTVELNELTYQIAGIYETNTYNKAILIPLVGSQKETIEEKSNGYSGAFLKVNDSQKAEAYLRNYKPYGRLKSREEFDSDDQYQIHYESWDSANYYNEITSFSGKQESVSLSKIVDIKIIIAFYAAIILIINVVLFLRKSERKYFKEKKSKKHITSYYVVNGIVEAVIACAIIFFIGKFSIDKSDTFVPMNVQVINIYVMIGACAIVSILCMFINSGLVKLLANESK